MTRRGIHVVAAIGVLCLSVVITAYATQRGVENQGDKAAPGASEPRIPLDPRFPFPTAPTTFTLQQHAKMAAEASTYKVDPYPPQEGESRTEAHQRALEELTARVVKLAPVPDQRLAFFAWMDRPDCPIRFQGWGCWLDGVEAIPGGYSFRLRVSAHAFDATSRYVAVLNIYVEEYTLTKDEGLRFLRGYPAPGDDGKPRFFRI